MQLQARRGGNLGDRRRPAHAALRTRLVRSRAMSFAFFIRVLGDLLILPIVDSILPSRRSWSSRR